VGRLRRHLDSASTLRGKTCLYSTAEWSRQRDCERVVNGWQKQMISAASLARGRPTRRDTLRHVQFDYSLASMLPLARSAIRETDNFDAGQLTDLLCDQLAKVGVPGITKQGATTPRRYNYGGINFPSPLPRAVTEVFFYLLYRGFILPEPQTFPAGFNHGRYWKTPRGAAWASGSEPLPEDVDGYVRVLSQLVPKLDPVILQYIREGLGSFGREMYFSAAVMLGAASEKEIYVVGQSLAKALKDQKKQKQLDDLLEGRSLYRLLENIRQHVATCSKLRGPFDGAEAHLLSLFEAIRVQRNDAVHPNTANVVEDSVRLSYDAFPRAIQKAEALRQWFESNPNSV
jgi:hypothetical protein